METSVFLTSVDAAVALTAALAVAGILIATAIPKLQAPAYFEGIVVDYQILPAGLSRVLARALPWVELCAALALMPTATRSYAAALLAVLVSAFGAAVTINLLRGRTRLDCGCGLSGANGTNGTSDGKSYLSWPLLGRNVFLLLLLALAASPDAGRALLLQDALTVGFGGAALIGLYVAADVLLANLPRVNNYRNL